MRAGGWRALGLFWLAVLVLAGGAAGTLAVLGPPRLPVPRPVPPAAPAGRSNNNPWPAPHPKAVTPIAAPDPQLLEPAPDFPGAMLPRIGPGGRRPERIYTAWAEPRPAQPRVALIVAGLGLNGADSFAAVAQLPAAVDFAVSAYADNPDVLLAASRSAGHEYLLSLPMEPAGYPLDTEGPRALLTGAPAADNALSLEWALSRFQGYFGVTGASDGQRGERYAASPSLMAALGDELTRRGLAYIDPRPPADAPERPLGRGVDVVLDEPATGDDVTSKLAELEQAARQHGAAIGLVGRPTPVTLARLAAWTQGLAGREVALVPVSALLRPADAL